MPKIHIELSLGKDKASVWVKYTDAIIVLAMEGKPWEARQTLRALSLALSDPGYVLTKVFGEIPPSDRERKEDHA